MLALGDVSSKVVKYLKGMGRIEDHYKYMKAPHHGTVAYFGSILPNADNVLYQIMVWHAKTGRFLKSMQKSIEINVIVLIQK